MQTTGNHSNQVVTKEAARRISVQHYIPIFALLYLQNNLQQLLTAGWGISGSV